MESSFVLYTEAWEAIALLSDVQRSALMQAIFSHHGACEMPNMDVMTKAIFLMMRPRFEANKAKYQEICEKRKVAGQKGGIAKGESSVAKKQMLICQKQNSHLDPDLDSDPDLENINTPPISPVSEEKSLEGGVVDFQEISLKPEAPKPESPVFNSPGIGFEQFINAYPEERRDVGAAIIEWNKLRKSKQLPGLPRLLEGLTAWEETEQWQKDMQFVPLASNFLAKRKWLDIMPRATPKIPLSADFVIPDDDGDSISDRRLRQ